MASNTVYNDLYANIREDGNCNSQESDDCMNFAVSSIISIDVSSSENSPVKSSPTKRSVFAEEQQIFKINDEAATQIKSNDEMDHPAKSQPDKENPVEKQLHSQPDIPEGKSFSANFTNNDDKPSSSKQSPYNRQKLSKFKRDRIKSRNNSIGKAIKYLNRRNERIAFSGRFQGYIQMLKQLKNIARGVDCSEYRDQLVNPVQSSEVKPSHSQSDITNNDINGGEDNQNMDAEIVDGSSSINNAKRKRNDCDIDSDDDEISSYSQLSDQNSNHYGKMKSENYDEGSGPGPGPGRLDRSETDNRWVDHNQSPYDPSDDISAEQYERQRASNDDDDEDVANGSRTDKSDSGSSSDRSDDSDSERSDISGRSDSDKEEIIDDDSDTEMVPTYAHENNHRQSQMRDHPQRHQNFPVQIEEINLIDSDEDDDNGGNNAHNYNRNNVNDANDDDECVSDGEVSPAAGAGQSSMVTADSVLDSLLRAIPLNESAIQAVNRAEMAASRSNERQAINNEDPVELIDDDDDDQKANEAMEGETGTDVDGSNDDILDMIPTQNDCETARMSGSNEFKVMHENYTKQVTALNNKVAALVDKYVKSGALTRNLLVGMNAGGDDGGGGGGGDGVGVLGILGATGDETQQSSTTQDDRRQCVGGGQMHEDNIDMISQELMEADEVVEATTSQPSATTTAAAETASTAKAETTPEEQARAAPLTTSEPASSSAEASGVPEDRSGSTRHPNPYINLVNNLGDMFQRYDEIVQPFTHIPNPTLDELNARILRISVEIDRLNHSIQDKEREWNRIVYLKRVKEEIFTRLIRAKDVLTMEPSRRDMQSCSLKDLKEVEELLQMPMPSEMPCQEQATSSQNPCAATDQQVDSESMSVREIVESRANMTDVDLRREQPTTERIQRWLRSGGELEDMLPNCYFTYPVSMEYSNVGDIISNLTKTSGLDHDHDPSKQALNDGGFNVNGRADNNSCLTDPRRVQANVNQNVKTILKNTKMPSHSRSSYPTANYGQRSSTSTNGGGGGSGGHRILNKLYDNSRHASSSHVPATVDDLVPSPNDSDISVRPLRRRRRRQEIVDRDEALAESVKRYVRDESILPAIHRNLQEFVMRFADDETPVCQKCQMHRSKFVCAGCGKQWYCSRECQISAWDAHCEHCRAE